MKHLMTVRVTLLLWGTLSTVSAVQAQVIHRCEADGRISYQAQPCEPAPVGAGGSRAPGFRNPEFRAIESGSTGFRAAEGSDPAVTRTRVPVSREERRLAGLPWAGLTAGMSVAEVKLRIPETRDAAGVGVLQNGAQALVVKDEVKLAGRTLQARYFFLGDGLHRVDLSHRQPADRAGQVLTDLGRLKIEMSQRFGAARVGEVPGLTAGRASGRLEWKLANGDQVVLMASPAEGGVGEAVLVFLPAGSQGD